MTTSIHVPPEGPPQGPGPSPEIYERMGEEHIFGMCRAFYAELEQSSIRPMFPEDMPVASGKLAAFLVQICGGPPLFNQRHGEPMMRRRHMKFALDEKARRAWLDAFNKTLDDACTLYAFPLEHLPAFRHWLDEFSAWMVNTR